MYIWVDEHVTLIARAMDLETTLRNTLGAVGYFATLSSRPSKGHVPTPNRKLTTTRCSHTLVLEFSLPTSQKSLKRRCLIFIIWKIGPTPAVSPKQGHVCFYSLLYAQCLVCFAWMNREYFKWCNILCLWILSSFA